MADGLPARKRPPHFPLREATNQSAVIFLTVCTHQRKALLARPVVHALLQESWRKADGWQVGNYVLMPDHLHLFCVPNGKGAPELTRWVKYWKSLASRQWPSPDELPVWQSSFWDRQLRTSESYALKWDYVRENPVRAGLVGRASDWPFAGELTEFRFRDR